jgi:hypothetical protein
LPPPPIKPVVIPKVSFVFVNRNGFRNDSTKHGYKDTVLAGVCLDLKYYKKNVDSTSLISTCYDRNFPANNYPLSDSIVMKTFDSYVGNKYGFQIELVWKQPVTVPYTTRDIKYANLGWPSGDTIKVARDTIIKFIWPKDTNSGKFFKTYQYP